MTERRTVEYGNFRFAVQVDGAWIDLLESTSLPDMETVTIEREFRMDDDQEFYKWAEAALKH